MAVTPVFNERTVFQQSILRAAKHVLHQLERNQNDYRQDVVQDALALLNYGIKSPQAWPQMKQMLIKLAPQMEQIGAWHDWLPYLLEGLKWSQKYHDREAEAVIRFHLGVLEHQLGNYDKAIRHLTLSEALYLELGDRVGQVRTLNRKAATLRRKRDFVKATEILWSAIAISEKENADTAYSYLLLGLVQHDQRHWSQAVQYFRKALSLSRKAADSSSITAWSYANLGTSLSHLQDFSEAENCFAQALRQFEQINDPLNRAVAQMNLGNMYLMQEKPLLAVEQYSAAYPVFQSIYDLLNSALVQVNLAMAYRELEDWEKSEQAYFASFETLRLLEDGERLANAMAGLGLVYLQQAHTDAAIAQFEEALDVLSELKQTPRRTYLCKEICKHLATARTLAST